MESTQRRTLNITVPGIGIFEASAEAPVPYHLRPLMKKDERQKFWINRRWPEDAFGKVFLARAAIRVGEAMFPDDWTGHEPGVDTLLAPLPAWPSQARPWETRAALAALPQDNRVPVVERLTMPRNTIDQRDWDKAVHLRQLALAELEAPRARWAAAQYRLREAMKMEPTEPGAVKYHVLDATTGDYLAALPNKWWNTTEHWQARFYWCQISLLEPITSAVGGSKFQRIFVDGADLDALCAGLTKPNVPGGKHRSQAERTRAAEAFKADLVAAISAAPQEKGNRVVWIEKGRQEYGLAKEAARAAWAEATKAVPGNVWAMPGRPRKA